MNSSNGIMVPVDSTPDPVPHLRSESIRSKVPYSRSIAPLAKGKVPDQHAGVSDEPDHPPRKRRILRATMLAVIWLILLPWLAWAFGALWFDFPVQDGAKAAAGSFGLVCVALALGFRGNGIAVFTTSILAAMVQIGWLQQQPLQNRNWKPQVAVLPWAEVAGDTVTIHEVRNFDYHGTDDMLARYETRHYRLSQLRGMELFLNYRETHWMAHPILSFDFGPDGRICFSVEPRLEIGERDSALRELYHGYETICIASDERDIVRLRTNYRKGEDTYLFRIRHPAPSEAFLEYVDLMNQLKETPAWYNAVTQNRATSLRTQPGRRYRSPRDWWMLVNGYLGTLLYERGSVDNHLPFVERKRRSPINRLAQAADRDPDFSARIREGLPEPPIPVGTPQKPLD